MSLCKVFRILKDFAKSKQYLELAREFTSDKEVLLQLYKESGKQLMLEDKFNSALDSVNKAFEIAKQLYKEDDYAYFELQFQLAEITEKVGNAEEAK